MRYGRSIIAIAMLVGLFAIRSTATAQYAPMQVYAVCDSNPFQIRISELPSRTCTVWIAGWRRDTVAPVQVLIPDASDGWGNHANGIQINFANMAVAPYNMCCFQGPDGSYGIWYPWTILVFACPAQQGTGANCYNSAARPGAFKVRLLVRQEGLVDILLELNGNALPATTSTPGPLPPCDPSDPSFCGLERR
jgi:hypothetical protein